MNAAADLTPPPERPRLRPRLAAPSLGSESPADRPALLVAGLMLVVIGLPLAFLPLSSAPFVDSKLAVLVVGALLMWASGLRPDSELALPAAIWAAVVAFATVFGIDRVMSLTGPDNQSTGLILLATCAWLLPVGAALPSTLRSRLPAWIAGTVAVVSAGSIVFRFAPALGSLIHPPLNFGLGSTLGEQALVAGFVAAGISVAPALRLRTGGLLLLLALYASALALVAERGGWLAAAVGLTVCLRINRVPRRRVLLIVATLIGVTLAWTVVDAYLRPAVPLSAARAFGTLGENSLRAHGIVFVAAIRSCIRRPLLGWGPGNTFTAFLASATSKQVLEAGRGWGDAHDLFAESGATTGLAGLAALGFLAFRTIRRIMRWPVTGWAAGSAAALLVLHLFQPLSVSMTPLLFLLAGVAAAPRMAEGSFPPPRQLPPPSRRDIGRVAVGGLLVIGLALSLVVLSASVFEAAGRVYGSEWALRTSLAIQPGRITAEDALAISLAVDARSGMPGAAVEARRLARRAVDEHPWNPQVRLSAADVELLLSDPGGARSWIALQRTRFPSDEIPAPSAGPSPPAV